MRVNAFVCLRDSFIALFLGRSFLFIVWLVVNNGLNLATAMPRREVLCFNGFHDEIRMREKSSHVLRAFHALLGAQNWLRTPTPARCRRKEPGRTRLSHCAGWTAAEEGRRMESRAHARAGVAGPNAGAKTASLDGNAESKAGNRDRPSQCSVPRLFGSRCVGLK